MILSTKWDYYCGVFPTFNQNLDQLTQNLITHLLRYDSSVQYHAARSYGRKTEKKSILFRNIQIYSKIFITFSNILSSSFILWGQNNDIYASKKVEKNYGIQPNHTVDLMNRTAQLTVLIINSGFQYGLSEIEEMSNRIQLLILYSSKPYKLRIFKIKYFSF